MQVADSQPAVGVVATRLCLQGLVTLPALGAERPASASASSSANCCELLLIPAFGPGLELVTPKRGKLLPCQGLALLVIFCRDGISGAEQKNPTLNNRKSSGPTTCF
ncbi:hypothetical protein Y1Q_0010642 [Alligator mississippiensis]|uniref:Uncharacterized protein n=1 Tax=Alligator mississippiensis TaxID=8496 RepID=A0A151M6B7_ALLMI|nr:hypothetical protein Y1Q_0010642 [Alligator mississippiensis]